MKWFFNQKVNIKLALGFFVVTLLAASTGIIGIVFLSASAGGISRQSRVGIILIGLVVLAAIAASILFCRVITRAISSPMKNNEKLAARVATGNLDTSDIVAQMMKKDMKTMERSDEIGAFTRSFKALLDKVRASLHFIEKVAEGDLTASINVTSERDQLGTSLMTLVNNLHGLVASIVVAVEKLTTEANVLSDSSLALSQGSTQQASAIQELTASLEQIAAQTRLNAQNAENASALAASAKSNASEGNLQMKDMLGAMEDISLSSGNINKIIKVIDDIAFQTNILALNAAVEAARAGQHGKGFAVVADEVRNLAAKSANAAKETTDLIENSIRKVESGMKIADKTAKSLDEIVVQVDRAADLVSSIARASAEQAQGLEQINHGIAQVSQVIQTTAATAEESAAASEELSKQASKLKDRISIFRLRNRAGASNSGRPAHTALPAKHQPSSAARYAGITAGFNAAQGSGFGKY